MKLLRVSHYWAGDNEDPSEYYFITGDEGDLSGGDVQEHIDWEPDHERLAVEELDFIDLTKPKEVTA